LTFWTTESKRGLVDVKFHAADVAQSTVEKFFTEVNAMLVTQDVDDPDFF
jgi:phage-related minor tail protein